MLELCAGVGGLGLGVHIAEAGSRSVAYIEREAYAAATLVARMEAGDLAPAAVWSDLTSFDATAWRGAVDCVVSGDPCQPNSVAGNRLGSDDDRFLIEHVVRIFDESGATRLFRENVTGNADGQLAAIVPLLERLGCRIAVGIFSAAEVGASHRRERLFIMADRADGDGRRGKWRTQAGTGTDGEWRGRSAGCSASMGDTMHPRPQSATPATLHRCEKGAGPRHEDAVERGSAMADASDRLIPQSGRGSQGRDGAGPTGAELGHADHADHADAQGQRADDHPAGWEEPDGSVGLSGRAGILFAPGPSDARWRSIIIGSPQLEPAVRRVADGLAHRVDRLRACGNGVVPLTAAYAWHCLQEKLRCHSTS